MNKYERRKMQITIWRMWVKNSQKFSGLFLQLFSITEIVFFNNLKRARCAYVQKYG